MSQPPKVRRHLVETGHGAVHVRTTGDGGTPLLCLHPALSTSRIYEGLATALGPDRLVVMPDRLGFGFSDRLREPISFPQYADSTIAVLDALGVERCDVFGVHTGSSEAIELATAHPTRIRRVAVVEVPGFTGDEIEEFKSHYVAHPAPVEDGSHLLWYWNWWRLGGYDGGAPRPTIRPPEEIQPWVIEHLAVLPDFWWSYFATIAHPIADLVRRVTQPLLVVSTGDDLTEQTTRAIPTLPPQAQVVELPHFADVLRFYAWDDETVAEFIPIFRRFLDTP